jgi:hypothetical protein
MAAGTQMSKEFFLDEWREQIALMRRNNGDAVAQHGEAMKNYSLVGELPCTSQMSYL